MEVKLVLGCIQELKVTMYILFTFRHTTNLDLFSVINTIFHPQDKSTLHNSENLLQSYSERNS
jgi:hypothetical protein